METTSNREYPSVQRSPGESLASCHLGIDVRYLRRPGVGIGRYVHQAVVELLASGADLTLITDDEDHCVALRVCLPGRQLCGAGRPERIPVGTAEAAAPS